MIHSEGREINRGSGSVLTPLKFKVVVEILGKYQRAVNAPPLACGSIPSATTKLSRRSSVGRVLGLELRCRRFDPYRRDH